MKADPKDVLVGAHYLDGNHACAEGAIAAGCKFFAGYPITPSTEIAERVARRFPLLGGVFVQMEDELASMNAILGGSWGGNPVYLRCACRYDVEPVLRDVSLGFRIVREVSP